MKTDDAEDTPSNADRLAQHAEACGWEVERRTGDLFEQSERRPTLGVQTMIAVRRGEVVTATWVDGWALGPIGWHVSPNRVHAVKNAASARRCLTNEDGSC